MGAKAEFLGKIKDGTVAGKDIILFIGALQEIAESNEDIKDMLSDMKEEGESFKINFQLLDTKRTASLSIENGKLVAAKTLLADPHITITMNEPDAIEILKGKSGILNAYRAGKIHAEGQLTKAAGLGMLLNIAGDELGVL